MGKLWMALLQVVPGRAWGVVVNPVQVLHAVFGDEDLLFLSVVKVDWSSHSFDDLDSFFEGNSGAVNGNQDLVVPC